MSKLKRCITFFDRIRKNLHTATHFIATIISNHVLISNHVFSLLSNSMASVPHDQVFALVVVYCLLFLLRNKQFHASFIHKNCCGQFLSVLGIFYSEKFSTESDVGRKRDS